LHGKERFDLIHCRSYLAAMVGLRMKRRHGTRFLFDMRGFWADERVDGRVWNLSNPVFRAVFDYFKRREAEFFSEADHIVSLTEAGKTILIERRSDRAAGPPISIIPCCVDFDSFPAVTADDRDAGRRKLGIPAAATVAVYVGSFGTWYMVEEMMDLFRVQLERASDAAFLIISRDPPKNIIQVARSRGVPADRLIIRSCSRADVPRLAAAADYALFFIQPVFSKKASSPTKMGEFLALELPMVTNGGVGDVDQTMEEAGAGVVVEGFDEPSYRRALDELERLKPDMDRWRNTARASFDLDVGIGRYDSIYRDTVRGS
jgi:glycosyltransferase involved in cell wall biosynthesis